MSLLLMVGLVCLVFVGAAIVAVVILARRQNRLACRTLEEQRQQIESLGEEVKVGVAETHLRTLTQVSEQLTLLTGQQLEAARKATDQSLDQKKALIDSELSFVNSGIEKVTKAVNELTRRSSQNFGDIAGQLAAASSSTLELSKTTNSLREMLSHARARGQHGEFATDGVLNAAGLQEGLHYEKQLQTESGTRPDYTVKIDPQKVLSLDSKFPFDNLLRHFQAESEADKKVFETAFFRDVRNRIVEVTTKDYINVNTVNLVVLFVPSESVFSFLLERDPRIIEFAMRRRVVVAGPFSLFAILSVIKQGSDNYAIEQKSAEILEIIGGFKIQWAKFVEGLEQLGRKLEIVGKSYDALSSTRRSQLQRSLDKIEALSDPSETAPPPGAAEQPSADCCEEQNVTGNDLESMSVGKLAPIGGSVSGEQGAGQ